MLQPPAPNELNAISAAARLKNIREVIDAAATKAGRDPAEVTLLGVSKTFSEQLIQLYLGTGLADFGESYIQEVRVKTAYLAELGLNPRWHFIGHLQTNKAKYAVPIISTLHSLDSLELAAELHHRLTATEGSLRVYVQVNVSGEVCKSGLAPITLPPFLEALDRYPTLNCLGLMTMPPYHPDPEKSRPYFAALRQLKEQYAPHLPGLSMGMSEDFEVAIAEGATIVRVGTALFGTR